MYPPIIQKSVLNNKHKGSAFLVAVLVLSITSSLLAVSMAKATQAGMSSSSASKVSLQAQQYAAAEGDIIRMTTYTDLSSKAKSEIAGTSFSKEVSIGTESDYTDTIKKKIVTVKIYRGSDSLPCYSLAIPRLSADVNGKGVPIGTVIIWASNNVPQENGVWLECNGQSCAAYPELAKVLGKDTVPDYRGVFLRGLGSQSFSQNNGSIIGVTSTVYTSGNLGAIQGDATRIVTGYFSFAGGMDVEPVGVFYNKGSQNKTMPSSSSAGLDNPYFDNSRVVPTANEIRPVNIAVRYFIRAV